MACLCSSWWMTTSLPLLPAHNDFDWPTSPCVRFQELAQVRVITCVLLSDCIDCTTSVSTYLIPDLDLRPAYLRPRPRPRLAYPRPRPRLWGTKTKTKTKTPRFKTKTKTKTQQFQDQDQDQDFDVQYQDRAYSLGVLLVAEDASVLL